MRTFLKNLARKLITRSVNPNNRPRRSRSLLGVEQLEDRIVPSQIVWTNRGSGSNDRDGFNASFGTTTAANAARAVVDRAIADWSAVITNFNSQDVAGFDSAPLPNTFFFEVKMDDHLLGDLGWSEVNEVDSEGRPWKATVHLDDNAGGSSSSSTAWFVDATPNDHSEFTGILSSFTASGPVGSADLYTVVLHEMGHSFGIQTTYVPGVMAASDLKIHQVLMDAGTDNVDGSSKLRSLVLSDGMSVVLTEADFGHLYEGTKIYADNGSSFPSGTDSSSQVAHPLDLLNSGRAAGTFPGNGTGQVLRHTISDLDARILRDVYGYTVSLPSSTIDNFRMDLDSAGVLNIRGNVGSTGDAITVSKSGSSVKVQMDGVSRTLPASSVNSISVNGNARDLVISDVTSSSDRTYTVDNSSIISSFLPTVNYTNVAGVTINAGHGADVVTVNGGGANGALDLTVDGGSNLQGKLDDLVVTSLAKFQDTASTYTITSSTIDGSGIPTNPGGHIAFSSLDRFTISAAENGTNVFNVQSTGTGTQMTLNGGLGALNTFNLGDTTGLDNFKGNLTVAGAAATLDTDDKDILNVNDQSSSTSRGYTLSATQLLRNATGTITLSGLEELTLNGTNASDTFLVSATPAVGKVTINGGGSLASDTLIGPNAGAIFTITGVNTGKVGDKVTFNSIRNLKGGTGTDRFVMKAGSSLGGTIVGGTGTDTLDYSDFTTGITADLAMGYATSVATNLAYIYGTSPNFVTQVENVVGGSGGDTLTGDGNNNLLRGNNGLDIIKGGGGNDILVGGDGNDTLQGEAGRDVLIGGNGVDTLDGGIDDDLLIAGFTNFDSNETTLSRLRSDWATPGTSTADFRGLIHKHLDGNVFDDAVSDTLTGGDGDADWFWGLFGTGIKNADVLKDRTSAELLN